MLDSHTVWTKNTATSQRARSSQEALIVSDPSQSSDRTSLSKTGTSGNDASAAQTPHAASDDAVQVLDFHARGGRELNIAEMHVLGLCNPCFFISTGATCIKGDQCAYCHMHWNTRSGRPKTKPRKSKRAHCGNIAARLDLLLVEDPDEFVTLVIDCLQEDDAAITAKVKTKLRTIINSDALNDQQFRRISEVLIDLQDLYSTKLAL
eukprot:TRINITY_DN5772_c0_g3_i1.p1 TRINITY_DN5772_c0_g3~~TRINITY_DN5772_c0_g3_i1.p1  ORF type:complete len:207 (-),score=19.04 TRINITY_DN5772_c0_g3_i1:129-749(-)